MLQRWWDWFCARADSAHARWWLFALAFSESSFFLVPPDVLLIAILSAGTRQWVRYAGIATLGSVLGAVFGYLLGVLLHDAVVAPIIAWYHLGDSFQAVGALYAHGTFPVVLTAAFTPIPFKVFVLAGGVFSVPFLPFITAAILGRAARFFLVAYISHRFGPRVASLCIAHFKKATLIFVLLLAGYLFIQHYDMVLSFLSFL